MGYARLVPDWEGANLQHGIVVIEFPLDPAHPEYTAPYKEYKIRLSEWIVNVDMAFTDLTDVPNSYVDQGGKLIRVNIEEDALEFVDPANIPLSTFSDDSTHRLVTDTEKSTWNGKQDALISGTNIKTINSGSLLGSGNIDLQTPLGFTPENVANKETTSLTTSSTKYPNNDVVLAALALKADKAQTFAPTAINFGDNTQEYDIDGTTWVASTTGIPDVAGHLLADVLTAIETDNDGHIFNVRESLGAASATNPNTLTFTFTGITDFNVFKARLEYFGSASHLIEVEIYNKNTTNWDHLLEFSSTGHYEVITPEILSPLNYIDTDGTVKVRLRHVQSGINTHYYSIDYAALGAGGGAGGDHIQTAIETPSTPSNNLIGTNVESKFLEVDAKLLGYEPTTSSGGTTTLDVNSVHTQRLTGTATHTHILPAVSTLTLNREFEFINDSTGIWTIKASNTTSTVVEIQPGTTVIVKCISLSGTDETSWKVIQFNANGKTISKGNTFSTELSFFADETKYNRGQLSGATSFTLGTNSNGNFSELYTSFETDGSTIEFPTSWRELNNEYVLGDIGVFGLYVFRDDNDYSFILFKIGNLAPSLLYAKIRTSDLSHVYLYYDMDVDVINVNGHSLTGTTSTGFDSITGSGTSVLVGALGTPADTEDIITYTYDGSTGNVVSHSESIPMLSDSEIVDIVTSLGLGHSLSLNNTKNYPRATLTGAFTLNNGSTGLPHSWSIWVRPTAFQAANITLFRGDGNSTPISQLSIRYNSASISIGLYTDNSNYISFGAAYVLPQNQYSHLLFVYKGGKGTVCLELYVNSVKQSGIYTETGTFIYPANRAYQEFGNYSSTNAFGVTGQISCVSEFDKDLSQSEVNELYADGFAIDVEQVSFAENLLAFWKFDNNLNDATGTLNCSQVGTVVYSTTVPNN